MLAFGAAFCSGLYPSPGAPASAMPKEAQAYHRLAAVLARMDGMSPLEESTHLDELARTDPEIAQAARHVLSLRTEIEAGCPDPAPPSAEAIWIGDYRLGRLLGDGVAAAVYEAFPRRAPEHPVALKVLQPWEHTDQTRRAFDTEQRALRTLDDPCFVPALDSGTTPDGRLWFTMELVHGEHLDDFVARHRLAMDGFLGLAIELCRAMAIAHEHGVLHMDLKPSNVMVEPAGPGDGQLLRLRVLDFGLARMFEPTAATHYTRSLLAPAGTLAYMAPEQTVFQRRISVRTDVYGIGATLFAAITGSAPCGDDVLRSRSPEEVYRWLREQPRPSFRSLLRGRSIPWVQPSASAGRRAVDKLDQVIATCLEVDPQRRYFDATQIADELERIRTGRPLLRPRRTRLRSVQEFVRTNRLAVVVACIVAAALLLGTSVAAIAASQATRAKRVAERQYAAALSMARELAIPLDLMLVAAPGQLKARQDLLVGVVQALESLSTDNSDDPELRRLLASMLASAGATMADPTRPNMGRVEESIAALERADELMVGLLADEPDDVELLRLLANTRLSRARVDFGRGHDGAPEWFAKAKSTLARLLKLDPDKLLAERINLVYADRMRATIFAARRRVQLRFADAASSPADRERFLALAEDSARDAEASAEDALASLNSLPPWPANRAGQFGLANAVQTAAETFLFAEQPGRAYVLLMEAGDLAARLANEHPQNAHIRLLVGANLRYAADAAALDGRPGEACLLMAKAIAAFDVACELDPQIAGWKDAKVVPWRRLSALEELRGDLDAALAAGETSLLEARGNWSREADDYVGFAMLWDGLRLHTALIERVLEAMPCDEEHALQRMALALRALELVDEAIGLADLNHTAAPEYTEEQVALLQERRVRLIEWLTSAQTMGSK